MPSHFRRYALVSVMFLIGAAVMSGCARVEVSPKPKIGIPEKGVGEGTPTPGEVLLINDQKRAIAFKVVGQHFEGQFKNSFTVEKEVPAECTAGKIVPEKTTEICNFTVNAAAGKFVKGLKATLVTEYTIEGKAGPNVETPVEME